MYHHKSLSENFFMAFSSQDRKNEQVQYPITSRNVYFKAQGLKLLHIGIYKYVNLLVDSLNCCINHKTVNYIYILQ